MKNKDDEVVKFNADLILFEPFILNDNSYGSVTETHQNILTFIKEVQKKKKDTVVILQPSNPIANGVFYPDQVKNLQEFAKSNDIPYINHWPSWTDPVSQYLDKNSNPNEKGSQIWYEFLKKYFIAE
ncbi:SGNH/GDSL hydrolase family protein [Bacillus sp. APMAM]|nr:SGNH/GDSL hydrolase family protein [Bacillus sp. APMAM]RTZ54373.1 SGNH/GDSL hydrolase family protein [Bacillus sp. SAJ1]